ncbi:LysR substrate-binding domain-containing protein [Paraburkholderia diazotrophica]|uniref:DNA-binding transcriptional regulator, LysR family n=1 Tax=Paraburkholderia diazotrophica TaxID=667676 RepID=A0A1H6YG26_9BURK|nr:LysR substrate-binding domain-containing protein [Paraburkholderia diazotrophica]SEJ38814.1 DNA-binding transcriptional regulator, LysR family [Paraburkholderia diazotrophica]
MLNLLRNLTLRQLQIFSAASQYESFARAADDLHLTQPAVSMQIKQLEEAIGLPLFERIGRRITLTEAGATLSHHAKRILGDIRNAEDAMRSLSSADSGTISIGLVSSARYFVPRQIARYAERHPKVDIRFLIGKRDVLLRQLQDNAIDLAVMGRPPVDFDAHCEPLAYNPHVIAASVTHPFVDAACFDLHELRHDTFLMREPGSDTAVVAADMFQHHLFTPARTLALDSHETVKQAVMAGMGVSVLPLHTLRLELLAREVSVLRVNGTPIDRVWHVVHMNAKQLSPTCSAFRRFLIEKTGAWLEGQFAELTPPPHAASPFVQT